MNKRSSVAAICLNPSIDRSISIPGFVEGEVNRVEWEQDDPGGKAVNVATVLSSLGHTVAVTGFLGDDAWEIYERLFSERGVQNRFLRVNHRTRSNIKIIDEVKHHVTDINFPGFRVSRFDLDSLKGVVDDLAATFDWFVFSGSLPAGAPDNTYEILIRRLHNKTVFVDTSGPALRHAIKAKPYGIKPNIIELEMLADSHLDSIEKVLNQASSLIDQGLTGVVVSMGERGALFLEEGEAVLSIPPRVPVRTTVGAGDALMAGWVSAKSRGAGLVETARFSTALALCSLQQIGRFIPDPSVIESLAREIVIQKP